MPGVIANASRCGERLAMRVRSGQTTKIGAFAHADAGDEESHGMRLRGVLLCGLFRQRQLRA